MSRSVVYLDEGMPENYALTEQAFSSYGRTPKRIILSGKMVKK